MEVNLKWRIVHEIEKAVSLHDCSIIFVKEPYQDCCLKPIQSISAQCCIAKVLLCKSNDWFLYECNTELKWVRPMLPSYRNCSTYLHWKSVNWFLHDGNILKWVSGEEKEMIFVRGMNCWGVNSFSHPRWKLNHRKFTACK